MVSNKSTHIKGILKKHKRTFVIALVVALVGIRIITGPQTVASGNGYSHQIGSFGECDAVFDGCAIDATHRQHHFFGNEDYCESCWIRYGKDMFERVSDTTDSDSIYSKYYDEYKCRHSGCEKRAQYSDWDKRFCSEHLQGTKYCRYPHCSEKIPINGLSNYCSKHD